MNAPHVTLLMAGLCALVQCVLTALVVERRVRARVHLLDGGDKLLMRRIRAHGNFIETVPMALLLLALLELNGLEPTWLWLLGGCLVLGRLMHAVGMLATGAMWSRAAGMALTLAALAVGGALCVGMFLR